MKALLRVPPPQKKHHLSPKRKGESRIPRHWSESRVLRGSAVGCRLLQGSGHCISLIVVIPGFNSVWLSIIKEVGGLPKVMQSTNHFISSGTRSGEIIHIISVGVRGGGWGWGKGGTRVCALCARPPGRGKSWGRGSKERARGDRELPRVQGGGKSEGVGGHRGGGRGRTIGGQARRGGRRPPGAARAARAVRQIPQGGRRQSPGAPGPAPATWHPAAAAATPPGARPGQPAARSRPVSSPPSARPPAGGLPDAAREPGEGAGERREASVTAAAERRQEADPAAS